MKVISYLLVAVFSLMLISVADATTLWTENFNYPSAANNNLETTSAGIWDTAADENLTVRNLAETFSSARDPDPGTKRGGTGGSDGNIFATRSLGSAYSSGVVSLEGYVDSRSSDSNPNNRSGF